MLKRQTTGSVVCSSCGSLVGVNDDVCYSCGRRNPGLWGFAPALRRFGNDLGFVSLVIYGCIFLYVASVLMTFVWEGGIDTQSILSLFGPGTVTAVMFGASGSIPVFGLGRWWSVLSAGWLHGGLLHIFFNMLWVRQLGPPTADIYGPGRMVIIYTVSCAMGFALSSLAGFFIQLPVIGGARVTLGASAPIFGLLGALVYYGRRGGSSMIRTEALGYALTLGLFGFIMPGVDNWAHGGGFLGGYLAGKWLDPLRPERMDHLVGAVVCIALTGLAVIASLLVPVF